MIFDIGGARLDHLRVRRPFTDKELDDRFQGYFPKTDFDNPLKKSIPRDVGVVSLSSTHLPTLYKKHNLNLNIVFDIDETSEILKDKHKKQDDQKNKHSKNEETDLGLFKMHEKDEQENLFEKSLYYSTISKFYI